MTCSGKGCKLPPNYLDSRTIPLELSTERRINIHNITRDSDPPNELYPYWTTTQTTKSGLLTVNLSNDDSGSPKLYTIKSDNTHTYTQHKSWANISELISCTHASYYNSAILDYMVYLAYTYTTAKFIPIPVRKRSEGIQLSRSSHIRELNIIQIMIVYKLVRNETTRGAHWDNNPIQSRISKIKVFMRPDKNRELLFPSYPMDQIDCGPGTCHQIKSI